MITLSRFFLMLMISPMSASPRVFISYSHDSDSHRDKVLELAQALRQHGIYADIDQFHSHALHHWPEWCERQIRPDRSDFVMVVCTDEYRKRCFLGERPKAGKGVAWEARLLRNELYDQNENHRIIPVGFSEDAFVPPSFLKGFSHCVLDEAFDPHQSSAYNRLLHILTKTEMTVKDTLGEAVHLPSLNLGNALPRNERQVDYGAVITDSLQEIKKDTVEVLASQKRHEEMLVQLTSQMALLSGASSERPLTPEEKFEKALEKVAEHYALSITEVKAQMEDFTQWVQTNKEAATDYQKSLASYAQKHFAQAALSADASANYYRQQRLRQQEEAQVSKKEEIKSLTLAGDSYLAQYQWELAIARYQSVVALRDPVNEPELWASAAMQVAGAMYEAGQYQTARPLYERCLEIRKRVRGEEHPSTLTSINNLGVLYERMGKYEKSLLLYKCCLKISERVLGVEHPSILTSMNNLGVLYERMGESKKALLLYERCLAIQEGLLGSEHPLILKVMNNLALLYKNMGDYKNALSLNERCFEGKKHKFGLEHPSTLASMNNLGALYCSMKLYTKAQPLYEHCLEVIERELGGEHPDTLASVNNLGMLYRNMGLYEKAFPLNERCLEVRNRELGAEHPDTIISMNNLALLYLSQKKYNEAMTLLQRAYPSCERKLGEDHPQTKRLCKNYEYLKQVIAEQGNLIE